MATVTPTVETFGAGLTRVKWVLAQNDDGAPYPLSGAADKSVHVFGTPDSGTLTMQGSNEAVPANYSPLHDGEGNNIAFTAAGIEAIAENTAHIRPIITGASALCALTCIVLAKA